MPCPAPIRNKGNASHAGAPATRQRRDHDETEHLQEHAGTQLCVNPSARRYEGLTSGPRRKPMPSGRIARPLASASWAQRRPVRTPRTPGRMRRANRKRRSMPGCVADYCTAKAKAERRCPAGDLLCLLSAARRPSNSGGMLRISSAMHHHGQWCSRPSISGTT